MKEISNYKKNNNRNETELKIFHIRGQYLYNAAKPRGIILCKIQ